MKPLIAAPLVAIVILACSEPLSPSAYIGNYPLRTVNGSTVPAAAPAAQNGCTVAFGAGALGLGDGVFTLAFSSGYGCPGVNSTVYSVTVGGSLSGRSSPLTARAIDPMGQAESIIEMSLSIAGSDAILTVPAGAMGLGAATTLVFGPKQ